MFTSDNSDQEFAFGPIASIISNLILDKYGYLGVSVDHPCVMSSHTLINTIFILRDLIPVAYVVFCGDYVRITSSRNGMLIELQLFFNSPLFFDDLLEAVATYVS